MTVSYQYEVASSTSGGFTRLLFMWKGSLYKLIYRELLLFLIAFGLLSALYRNAFTLDQRRLFEKVVIYCDTFINLIPLSFVLGFYVAYVAGRWWQQFMAIPWPDKTMHSLALYVGTNDEQGRILRRTLMRYLNLSLILVLRSISSAVKRRFPTMDHLVEAGFMTREELVIFSAVPSVEFNTYWIPCTWFICHLKDAKNAKKVEDPQGLKLIMEEFNEFRSKCGLLWSYDWISIPLVYTQVVTLATYSFFLAALVGRQYVENSKKQLQMEIDIYLPVFTILQFFFFMGLLKVAEQLINPFGDDDEDFELNWLIDRHTKVSYLGVDILMTRAPPLVKDKYFDELDLTLPYTGAAVAYKKKTYRGSVHNMPVPEDQQSMFLPEITEEEEEVNQSARNTPKNSYPNLHVVNSGAEGIWRQSVGGVDIERLGGTEEPRGSNQDLSEGKIKKFFRRGSKKSNQGKTYSTSEVKAWSSNSTIDSFCSTTGNIESSFDTPENSEETTIEVSVIKKTNRKRTDSEPSRSSIPNLNIRRQSNSSGQWKGVRWKPVIKDTTGDVWSNNIGLRQVTPIQQNTPAPSEEITPEEEPPGLELRICQMRTGDDFKRRNTDPLSKKLDQKIRCQAFHVGCIAYNHVEKGSIGSSLPNLHISEATERETSSDGSDLENNEK